MSKFTFPRLSSLVNGVSAINGVITEIETALNSLFSRDGVSPNTWTATVDANSSRVINLPKPEIGTEPVRLQDLTGLVIGNITATTFTSINGEAGSPLIIGNVVYVSGPDQVKLAQADSGPTALAVGLCSNSSVAVGAEATIQLNGAIEATTLEWDVVAGTAGGLTSGATYYLDPDNAGKLTSTCPSVDGQYVVILGVALSPTKLLIEITQPILR